MNFFKSLSGGVGKDISHYQEIDSRYLFSKHISYEFLTLLTAFSKRFCIAGLADSPDVKEIPCID